MYNPAWLSYGKLGLYITLYGCPSQINENLMISNSKLTSDIELIW